jgi:hypothetical protein
MRFGCTVYKRLAGYRIGSISVSPGMRYITAIDVHGTDQFPPLFGDFFDTSDRLHENLIGDTCFWHPNCTKKMYPFAVNSLLKRASFVRAQNACLEGRDEKQSTNMRKAYNRVLRGDGALSA